VWLRIDDGFADHPKIEALSSDGLRAHLKGMCYCARYLTDGKVPATVARRMADPSVLDELQRVGRDDEKGRPGLWEEKDGYFVIHDFLDFNPSREEYEQTVARKSAAGKRSAEVRWGKSEAPVVTDAETPATTTVETPVRTDADAGVVTPVRTPVQPSRPVPSRPGPVPTPHEDTRAREPDRDPPKQNPDPPPTDASDLTLAEKLRELQRGMRSAYEELYREVWRFSWACEPGFRDRLREGRTVDELLEGWRWFLTSRKKRAQATPQGFLKWGWDEWCAREASRAPTARSAPIAATCEVRWPDGMEAET
jgi:hypothetical protein